MANLRTGYAMQPDDEQDEIARLMDLGALVPPMERPAPVAAEPEPIVAPVVAPEPAAAAPEATPIGAALEQAKTAQSEWDALAGPPPRRADVAPPPEAQGQNKWLLGAALAADMVLNKGRSAGQLVAAMAQPDDAAFENYQRKMQHEKDLASIDAKRSGLGTNPLGWLRYQQSQERLGAQIAEQKRKAELDRAARDPNSEESKRAVDAASRLYPQLADKFRGASQYELEKAGYLREAYAGQREDYRDKDFVRQGEEFDRREGTRQGNRIETIDYQEGKKIEGEGREAERKEEARQVFGYTRTASAPKISADEAEKIRKTAAAVSGLEDAIDELSKIEASISTADRAKGKLGYTTDQVAEANQWQQEIAGQLRVIANFGTPQAGELAITYARVPEVASVDGWLNGAAKYRALAKVMRKRVDSELKAQGYLRDGAEDSAPKSSGGTKQRTVPAPRAAASGAEPTEDDLEGL